MMALSLSPLARRLAFIAAAVFVSGLLLGTWTWWHRHDAVADYKREVTARNAAARAAEQSIRQENEDAAHELDDDALRDAIRQRLRDPD